MTYAEQELGPLGFKFVEKKEIRPGFIQKIVLSFCHLKLQFDCGCPDYPHIKTLGCPLHHKGPGGSHSIETAKEITSLFS